MKQLFSVIVIASLAFTACGDGNQADNMDMSKTEKDTAAQASSADDKDVKTVSVTYTDLDPKVAASIKEIVGHYLHIKNALANDNGQEASNGGEAMFASMKNVDKSFFTAEQKKVYEDNEEDLKEHAGHIGKSKIDHSREHFAMMSEEVYALVKAFGAGKPLYHDHCPMYDNNKGAMWLSETFEVRTLTWAVKCPNAEALKKRYNKRSTRYSDAYT